MANTSVIDLILKNDSGELLTTSLIVAERFGKEHKDVLKAIENLECSQEFRKRNFALSSYISRQGKTLPMVEMPRDGFSFLAMGFTGSEAAHWKEQFIGAFNEMERQLLEQQRQRFALPPDLIEQQRRTDRALEALIMNQGDFRAETRDRFDQVDGRLTSIEDIMKGIVNRRPFGAPVLREWNGVLVMRYERRCPCCQEIDIVDAFGRPIAGVYEADHWYQPSKNGVSQGWPVCKTCNHGILETDRRSRQSAFDHFHVLRKLIYRRVEQTAEQSTLTLVTSP